MSNNIAEAKVKLSLVAVMYELGLGGLAKKSARCPFHNDEHPSFSVFKNKSGAFIFKCHACGAAGDQIDFIERYKNVSRGEAIKLFCKMAGVTPSTQTLSRKSSNGAGKHFDWQQDVSALKPKHLEHLGNERWYSRKFCAWLYGKQLVGLHDGDFAFPVRHNGDDTVAGAHYRVEDGSWRYTQGVKAAPLVIGNVASAKQVHAFESQWDMLALADRTDLYREKSVAFVATRGADNAAVIKGLIPQSASVCAWPQNDKPSEKWLVNLAAHAGVPVAKAVVPARFKDVNAWTSASPDNGGARAEDLFAAMFRNELVEKREGIQSENGADEQSEATEPFPLHCLPSPLEAMAKAVCETERVPESLAGCCAIGILSASIGAGLQVQSAPNRATRGNVYVLISAQSGSGKSETFRHLARPFQQFERERLLAWKAQTLPGLLAERDILESEIAKLKKQAGNAHDAIDRDEIRSQLETKKAAFADVEMQLRSPILSCEDVTTEKLAVLLAQNGEQLASLSADALSIVNVLLGRYSKLDRTDEGLYLKAFSGDVCRVDRQSRESVSLESPCLAACWLTQPDKLEALLAERSLNEGGLIPRILACHTNCQPREIVDNTPAIPASVSTAYADLICSLLETYRLATESFLIHPTPEALRAMNAHHNAIVKRRRGELRDVTSFAARWNEQAWRIAVCLHAAQHGAKAHHRQLELGTAQRAITIADWFAAQQLEILNAGRTQRKTERLEKLRALIVQQYHGKTTLRLLKKKNGFEPDETRELAAEFPGMLIIEKRETGGRPSEIISIPKK